LSGRTRQEHTGIGVAMGPGGFTGVRTGLAAAKTIAQVLGLPVYGIGTLDALAFQFPGPHLVSAMLDARRQLVFAGLYRVEGDRLTVVRPAELMPFTDWRAILAEATEPVLAVGEGASRHREALEEIGALVPSDALMAASGLPVARLAEQRLEAGVPSELETLEPRYLREPQAVVNWEAAQQAKENRHGANP
ncbi:MAG TPA: tRNA (adenosine(37)-N6)-threonylcarbamoyltransferase complex dimerization subunit type 1 TsaB, partial [Oscillatoriaceae cyanobacterium]